MKSTGVGVDGHFRTQFESLGSGRLKIDQICDLEDLTEGLSRLQSSIEYTGMDLGALAQELHANKTGAGEDRQDLLTPTAKALIQELYPNDFETYGYSKG